MTYLTPTGSPASQPARPLRVVIQQGALPEYRRPVFAELARRQGLRVRVIYGQFPDLSNVDPVGFEGESIAPRTLRLAGRSLLWYPQGRRLTDEADVLVLSWNANDLSLLPKLWRAQRRGVGTVLWGHGYGKHDRLWRRLPRTVIGRAADAVLLYDRETAGSLVQRGFESSRVFVAQNALDERPMLAAKRWWLDRPGELRNWQTTAGLVDRPVVLFVSRITPKVEIGLLIEAMRRLRQRLPRATCVVVGSGDVAEARHLAVQAGLNEEAFRLVGPVYQQQDLAPYFLTARCLAYPAQIGLSVLHAFAYGLPVVTGHDPAAHNPEIVALRNGENGLLFHPGYPAAFADQMHRIVTDPALHARLSAEAERTVVERFNLKTMVDGFEAAIRFAALRAGRQGAW